MMCAAGYIKLIVEMPAGSRLSAKQLLQHKESLSSHSLVVDERGPANPRYAHVASKVKQYRERRSSARALLKCARQPQPQANGSGAAGNEGRARARVRFTNY